MAHLATATLRTDRQLWPNRQHKLIKIGAKVVRHARQVVFQMAEVAVPRELFWAIHRSEALLLPGKTGGGLEKRLKKRLAKPVERNKTAKKPHAVRGHETEWERSD
jgi:hypothetical protein